MGIGTLLGDYEEHGRCRRWAAEGSDLGGFMCSFGFWGVLGLGFREC